MARQLDGSIAARDRAEPETPRRAQENPCLNARPLAAAGAGSSRYLHEKLEKGPTCSTQCRATTPRSPLNASKIKYGVIRHIRSEKGEMGICRNTPDWVRGGLARGGLPGSGGEGRGEALVEVRAATTLAGGFVARRAAGPRAGHSRVERAGCARARNLRQHPRTERNSRDRQRGSGIVSSNFTSSGAVPSGAVMVKRPRRRISSEDSPIITVKRPGSTTHS